ncbi:MAG TPA: hypothetical protein VGM50_16330 [Gemmatimonadaceae bacterium]
MAHANPLPLHQHSHHIEAVGLLRPPVSPNPCGRRPGQLSLLGERDCFHRIPKLEPPPSFDLDEGDRACTFDDEIDIAMSHAEAALNDAPSLSPQPSLRDPLAQFAELLRGR